MNQEQMHFFAEELADYLYPRYFASYPSKQWKVKHYNGASSNFGIYVMEKSRYSHHMHEVSKVQFNLALRGGMLFFTSHSHTGIGKHALKEIVNDFISLAKEKNLNVLINCSYGITMHLAENKRIPFYAINEKGEKIMEILGYLTEKEWINFSNNWSEISLFSDGYANKKVFSFIPCWEDVPYLEFQKVNNAPSHEPIRSKEDADAFLAELEEDREFFVKKEQEIAELVKKADATSYYSRTQGFLSIFGKRVPFYIAPYFEKKRKRYKIRFLNGYNKGDDLDKVVEKVKIKIEAYLKKNRLRAAVNGKTFDFVGKFLYKLLGYEVRDYEFHKLFHTSMSETDFNHALRPIIEEKTTELPSDVNRYFQMYIRQLGNRHKIKSSLQFGPFYAFLCATKIFIVTEEEFKEITLKKEAFTQKKDKLLVDELNKWKETIQTAKAEV